MIHGSSVLAVMFDWAGTIIDYGSIQPAQAFQDLFRTKEIEIPMTQIRKFFGI